MASLISVLTNSLPRATRNKGQYCSSCRSLEVRKVGVGLVFSRRFASKPIRSRVAGTSGTSRCREEKPRGPPLTSRVVRLAPDLRQPVSRVYGGAPLAAAPVESAREKIARTVCRVRRWAAECEPMAVRSWSALGRLSSGRKVQCGRRSRCRRGTRPAAALTNHTWPLTVMGGTLSVRQVQAIPQRQDLVKPLLSRMRDGQDQGSDPFVDAQLCVLVECRHYGERRVRRKLRHDCGASVVAGRRR